jgi:hypothetical protein
VNYNTINYSYTNNFKERYIMVMFVYYKAKI